MRTSEVSTKEREWTSRGISAFKADSIARKPIVAKHERCHGSCANQASNSVHEFGVLRDNVADA